MTPPLHLEVAALLNGVLKTPQESAAPSVQGIRDGSNMLTRLLGGPGEELMACGDRLRAPDISPLYSHRLAAFPRSMVITAEFDLLHDEGNRFAEKLSAQGVAVEHLQVPEQIHGFMRFRKALTDAQWGPDAVCDRIGAFLNFGE